jgi:hypothetical protein
MFIDKEKDKPQNQVQYSPNNGDDPKRNVLLFGGFALFLSAMIFIAFLVIYTNNDDGSPEKEEAATSTEETGKLGRENLPGEADDSSDNKNDDILSDVEAEKLSFGDFYEKKNISLDESGFKTYELPINVKVDVANYYDISRKIDLEENVKKINNNGFAKIDNPFAGKANNFYSLYRELNAQEIPPLITSDFLIYYYQNILKKEFKEIEHSIFYENLWDINHELYTVAKARYEKRRKEVGVTNDPLLEASRKEMAFFAVALKLLEPTDEQVETKGSSGEKEEKFTGQEAYDYSLELPAYLKTDVLEEVELIREGQKEEGSPVLLYYRDYREDFQIPEEYRDTARLKNFYLASQWLNSNFPLYHRTEECPECLLDKEDWRISMITSFLISKDLSDDQVLQNKWARIYKIVSFFKGLRQDLTYLNYNKALVEVLGENIDLAEEFADHKKTDQTLLELQKKLEEHEFAGIEGGHNTDSTSTMPMQGLKVLTEGYWPSDYIFKKLTYPEVGVYERSQAGDPEDKNNITACELDSTYYRCRGFAFDIINLVEPKLFLKDKQYFIENTDYIDYDKQERSLKEELKRFNNYTWYGSNFWSLMSVLNNYLQEMERKKPAFMKGDAWHERKLNASLGAFTNLQLDLDVFKIYQGGVKQNGSHIGGSGVMMSEYAYVEPDLSLINELISNSEMLLGIFDSLKITDQTASIKDDMQRMIERQKKIKEIMEKELKGEDLDEGDYEFLHEFIFQYRVDRKSDKVKEIPFGNGQGTLIESIDGVDLLLTVYQKGEKKFLTAGPVFDHEEGFRR